MYTMSGTWKCFSRVCIFLCKKKIMRGKLKETKVVTYMATCIFISL